MAAQKFRKKPVEIWAMQWDGTDETSLAIRQWTENRPDSTAAIVDTDHIQHRWDYGLGAYKMPTGKVIFAPYQHRCLIVLTLEGEMVAELSDWIIRGVQGEFYPCKPDIFAATYEAVD